MKGTRFWKHMRHRLVSSINRFSHARFYSSLPRASHPPFLARPYRHPTSITSAFNDLQQQHVKMKQSPIQVPTTPRPVNTMEYGSLELKFVQGKEAKSQRSAWKGAKGSQAVEMEIAALLVTLPAIPSRL